MDTNCCLVRFPQGFIQFLCHCFLYFLIEVGIVEQLCEGVVVIQEALGHDIPEFIREQRPNKHFCAVILGIFFEFLDLGILHKHLVDALNDDPVGIREVAAETLVYLVDDALEGILLLVRNLWRGGASWNKYGRLFIQNNGTFESFCEGSIFQLNLVLNINKFSAAVFGNRAFI